MEVLYEIAYGEIWKPSRMEKSIITTSQRVHLSLRGMLEIGGYHDNTNEYLKSIMKLEPWKRCLIQD